MAAVVHRVVPNADAIVILRDPGASFAPWDIAEKGTNATAVAEAPAGSQSIVTEDSPDDAVSTNPPVNEPIVTSEDQDTEADTVSTAPEVWYYVSRSHLTVSSPIFERMLSKSSWTEGLPNEDDGLYHIATSDWDEKALLYFLQVLHLRNRQLPRTVSLEMLAKIAVLIDYFDCAEALEPFTDKWKNHLLMTPRPSKVCRDLMLWMCVAWVLRLPKTFVWTTTIAAKHDEVELPTLGLPIAICVEKIEKIRTQAIGNMLSQLQDLLQKLRSPAYRCPDDGLEYNSDDDLYKFKSSFECGSILFGALVKEMLRKDLLPIPKPPYSGLRVSELHARMQDIKSPVWCQPGRYHGYKANQPHGCDLEAMVMEIANRAKSLATTGPVLKDFGRD